MHTSALLFFNAIYAANHARTSSLAADMSFATLCLTWFIVQLATHRTGFVSCSLTSKSFSAACPALTFFSPVPHQTLGALSFASCEIACLTMTDCGRKGWVKTNFNLYRFIRCVSL